MGSFALQLLAYIKKDKQGDSLIDKLCQRYAATEDPHQWHNISFCLTQVGGCVGCVPGFGSPVNGGEVPRQHYNMEGMPLGGAVVHIAVGGNRLQR